MYAYREIVTIDDPKTLVLSKALPLRKGQRIELVVLAQNEDEELEELRDLIACRGVDEQDIRDAIVWSRTER